MRGHGFCAFAAASFALVVSHSTDAREQRPFQVGADLGYAFPGGSLERGSELSDVTLGLAALAADGAYRLHRAFSAGVAFRYGLAVPNDCASGSDCWSSLGYDFTPSVLGRWHIGMWGAFEPDLELDLGYEWFAAEHSDSGVGSSRRFRGLEAGLAGHGQFRISRLVSIGPLLELSTGAFSHTSLEAPGVETSRSTEGTALHVWLATGIRGVASF